MYQELIRQLYEEKKELESSVQIEKQELSDYYSMWVHQIKTPIAALGVLIQSGEEVQESPKAQELTRSMKMEVFRIEQYVDMVLTYLRMGSATSDYAFRTLQPGRNRPPGSPQIFPDVHHDQDKTSP